MKLRFVKVSDAQRLLAIYSQYISTPTTFEQILPSVGEFEERIADISAEYPYIVCEDDGEIIAYAYAHRCWERAAYQWGAELSVYVDALRVSQGVGKRLYSTLLRILPLQRVNTVYGVVTMPNEKSRALHEGLGFRQMCLYEKVGYKDGAWRDVAWFVKRIAPLEDTPQPFKPISELPSETLNRLMEQ